ncbi:MAG: polysaccharide biosynthesis C-terminal domain-containing protein [Oscillospiraceae bacterium]|nr:polysaccharide biosynthesis C-terminal domain-containing protein [Oscillospiraceae bacterium]
MGREKSLVKNTAIIAIGKISTQFVSFLLLPLYTALLSTEEYGTVDLFNTYIRLFLPILTLMVEQGAFRYLLSVDSERASKVDIVTNSATVITGMNIIFVIGECILFYNIKIPYAYYLIPMLILSSYSSWLLQIARGFKMTALYSLGSFTSAAVHILMNVVFIAGLHKGVHGMLIATIIGHVSSVALLAWKLKIFCYIDIKAFDKVTIKKMLAYSIPLIPNTLSLWIINSSDRTIVNYFLGTSANGILAVSHKFPAIFQTVFSIFLLSWQEFATVHWNDKDWETYFNTIFDKILRLFSAMCVLIISVLPIVFPLLINKAFTQAYDTIPIYMVAMLLNITIGLGSVVYVATKKTKEIAKTTIFAGIVNIVLHIILIRQAGLFAAAISTFVAYFCAMVYRMYDTKKIINLHLKVRTLVMLIIALSVTFVCYYQTSIFIRIIGIVFAIVFSLYFCKDVAEIVMKFAGKTLKQHKIR